MGQTRMIQCPLAFRMNINPTIEYWPTTEGKFVLAGSSIAVSINDGFYVGAYWQHSLNNLKSNLLENTTLGLSHGGIVIGGIIYNPNSIRHQTEKSPIQLVYNFMLGYGTLTSSGKTVSKDYFYEASPGLEIEYKFNSTFRMGIGAYTKVVTDLNQIYKNNDLHGYGIRIDAKFSFFDYKFGMLYRNRILGL